MSIEMRIEGGDNEDHAKVACACHCCYSAALFAPFANVNYFQIKCGEKWLCEIPYNKC